MNEGMQKFACIPFWYDGHAASLWWKSTRGVVANEPHSDSQGLYREVQARRRDSEIVA